MPGIVVGVDGSANARRALEWAIREGAIKNAPVTVVTVNEVAASFWTGNPITVPADEVLLGRAREAATELADKAVAEFGESRPASVTVKAVNGFAATSSSVRHGTPTCSWSGPAAAHREVAWPTTRRSARSVTRCSITRRARWWWWWCQPASKRGRCLSNACRRVACLTRCRSDRACGSVGKDAASPPRRQN
jgi:hypothetical protein